jgi:hypothetical protein
MRSFPTFAALRYPALAAMLLLSFAPTISRLLAASSSPSGWVQLCTMSGLKPVWLNGAPLPTPDHSDDGDCAYCPLLGAMLGTVFVFWLAAAKQRVAPRQTRFPTPSIASRIHGSLGARGPPSQARFELAA